MAALSVSASGVIAPELPSAPVAHAQDGAEFYNGALVTRVAIDEGTLMARKGNVQMSSVREQVRQQIRDVRAKMWDENVVFTESGQAPSRLRDVAAKHGIYTKQQYLDAVQFDSNAERVALQRAVEASMRFAHDRTNGTGAATASANGMVAGIENLASTGALGAVNAWASEYPDLVAAGGAWNSSTGHLWNLLNPAAKTFGQAAFSNFVALRVGTEAPNNQTWNLPDGEYLIPFAADDALLQRGKPSRTQLQLGETGHIAINVEGEVPKMWDNNQTPAFLYGAFESADPSIVTVTPPNQIYGAKTGTTTLTINPRNTQNQYTGKIQSVQITVVEKVAPAPRPGGSSLSS